ncbi:MAG: DUF6036 family nucleotidyltransferase [Bacteroidia bacterium]
MINADFLDFICILNAKEVEYLIVGGYAVSFHGYPRYTGDLDIWIKVSEENAIKMMSALNDFGINVPNLSVADFLRTDEMAGIFFGREPQRIDIINVVDGINFEACYEQKEIFVYNDITIPYLNFEDLKINKLSSGRAKDKADIKELEKRKKKKDKPKKK